MDALHCLRIAVTLFDGDERLVFANQHFRYLFRSLPPREELIGLSYEQLVRLEIGGGEIAESEIADPAAFIARRRGQFRTGEFAPLDIHLADGRIVEIKARRTRNGGWIVLWTDVTAGRHAQTRLEDALMLSADAFAFYDSNDRLAMCSERYAEFCGFARASAAIGKTFAELLDASIGTGQVARVQGCITTGQWRDRRLAAHRAPAGMLTVERRNGEAYLLRDRPTAEGGRVVVFTDVTDRRRVEAALEEQTRALAESRSEAERQASYLADLARRFDQAEASADTTKTTLLRTMSHELKTPLNAIIGFSDLMLSMGERLSPEQIREYAALIHDGGNNLLRLINQILDLTKLSAGRYDLNCATVDAAALLRAVHRDFEDRARARNLCLGAADIAPVLYLRADESALSAMVAQLLDNALAFTPAGGEIRLRTAREGGCALISVADNGPGVAEEDLARILKPFEQGGCGIADHTAGAGLGLTLVKALAEAQGGRLAIESARGRGFTATLSLPAVDGPQIVQI